MPPKQVLDDGLAWNFHVPRRPLGAVPTAGVAGWIAATPPGVLHVSVLTMGEIGQGIARIRGRGDQDQASALERRLRDPVPLPVEAAWGAVQAAAAGEETAP